MFKSAFADIVMKNILKVLPRKLYISTLLVLVLLCFAVGSWFSKGSYVNYLRVVQVLKASDSEFLASAGSTLGAVFLMNGATPYSDYYGYGQYDNNSEAALRIRNRSGKDIVVLFVKESTGEVYRNIYIRNFNNYKLCKIPSGRYSLRIALGNSWNPDKDNGLGLPRGGFAQDVSFMQSCSENVFDYGFISEVSHYADSDFTLIVKDNDSTDSSLLESNQLNFFE